MIEMKCLYISINPVALWSLGLEVTCLDNTATISPRQQWSCSSATTEKEQTDHGASFRCNNVPFWITHLLTARVIALLRARPDSRERRSPC